MGCRRNFVDTPLICTVLPAAVAIPCCPIKRILIWYDGDDDDECDDGGEDYDDPHLIFGRNLQYQ